MGVEKNTEATPAPEEEVVKTELEEVEEVAGTEEETTEEVVETPAEETAETPDEVADEGEVISKAIDDLKETVTSSLEKTREETALSLAALERKIDEAKAEFINKSSELDEKLSGFGEKLDTAKNRLAELEKNLEKINDGNAVRKSSDLSDEPLVKNVQSDGSWNGAFSGKREGATPRFPLYSVTS